MYPTLHENGPASAGQYVPYLYQSGLYLRYGVTAGSGGRPAAGDAYSTYDFSTNRPPLVPFDRVQTVEEVVRWGWRLRRNADRALTGRNTGRIDPPKRVRSETGSGTFSHLQSAYWEVVNVPEYLSFSLFITAG